MWDPRHPGSLGISRDEVESLGLSLSHSQRTLRLAHTLSRRLTFQLTLSERTTPVKNPRLRMASQSTDPQGRGGALMKQTSLSALVGQGFHGVCPFWVGFRPCREARPLHACPDSQKRYCTKILPRKARRRYCTKILPRKARGRYCGSK